MDYIKTLSAEFNIKSWQVQNTITLIDDGNTIPFIARYRKEKTGELDDQILRSLHERLLYLRSFEQRKEDIRRLIDEQGKLEENIINALEKAKTLQELEDIYRPYKQKKKTRASVAKNKGLEPLANYLLEQNDNVLPEEKAEEYINKEKEVNTIEDALNGAKDIIAEKISDNADIRKKIRQIFLTNADIVSKAKKQEDSVYSMYYDYNEPVSKIPSHRILAINRGEKEDFLKISLDVPVDRIINYIKAQIIENNSFVGLKHLEESINDSYSRLIFPSVEREIRNILTEKAEEQAMIVFKENLKNLLMQPPVKGNNVLGLDPAYRTGCKIAVVDHTGKVLDTTVIYPTPPQNKITEAKKKLTELIIKHDVNIIAIGNGTASKESEIFTAELIKEIDKDLLYMVVSEAGASVYSASKLGAEEFPQYDVALRSAVSIARRLQDPLAELVKIDPKAIGVGQYQHDMNQKKLGETLKGVVEDCVNNVGVDLNTSSAPLLSYISGINTTVAKNIVLYREENGEFTNRKQLLKVSKLGPKAYLQCAGFLRIPDGANEFDNTAVHPESYNAAEQLLDKFGFSKNDIKTGNLSTIDLIIKNKNLEEIANQLEIGLPTLKDIIKELKKPGRDPRDELPKPMLRNDVMHLEDLKPDMIITGTVRNVADFGAFVDIGVHQDGLVHISQLADRFIKNPMEVVSVGDIVKVKILNVDIKTKRISLTMKEV